MPDKICVAAVHAEAAAREKLASQFFVPGTYLSDPLRFNIWLSLRNGWTRSAFAGNVRRTGAGGRQCFYRRG
ncbi:hypothetical protein C5L14_24830 [Labrys okinawensis]|uniref:Uncharacterized protein n=1 Tax=Labrys okinawensis TaxID=346911 RepID=A0A2S9Q624_9HYPH|nr:hypothetical protein [Labrys okinawensis]PRH84770.1 hypothetical protein C5L14_24830 [Labrys okinawensis]